MDISLNIAAGYEVGVHEIVRIFFPEARILYYPYEGEIRLGVEVDALAEGLLIRAHLQGALQGEMTDVLMHGDDIVNARREIRRLVFLLFQDLTSRHPSPYGVLAGVRPVKLVHKILDRGSSPSSIVGELQEDYLVDGDKARLLTEVALRNRPYLLSREEARKVVGVYIGIPYCPSRCHYCSFPGYGLDHNPGVAAFLDGLIQEIDRVGAAMGARDIRADSIYIGGGTPTVLSSNQWQRLLLHIREGFGPQGHIEFTVEAGRPDTIDAEILSLLLEAGVNRLCINPQTMSDETLQLIGRRHSAQMTVDAFHKAREAGFTNINMDLIAGLPGEGAAELVNSLSQLIRMGPEGITIHHLARKRGSEWDKANSEGAYTGATGGTVEAYRILEANGYLPYYLYRQKKAAGNLENLGFARLGYFSLYNMRVIEERQTIIGFGGGSSSKFVNSDDWSHVFHHHPKDPTAYLAGLESLINSQVDKLNALS